jgi:glycosyltransferase involved in cell wall biosynthesis
MCDSGLNSDSHSSVYRPMVSVIIPSYNTARYIAETLDSVFAQTLKDYEVIVINDGSPDTDALEKIIQPYRDRILYLKQENWGLAAARNTGIRRSRGEYLAFLDSDDAWAPEYLAEQMKLFQRAPELDVVYSDNRRYTTSGEPRETFMEACPSRGPVTFESLVLERCQIPVSFAIARRSMVLNAGLFDESFRRSEDYDLWLRILWRGGKVAYQKRVLGRALVRGDSLSSSDVGMLKAAIAVLTKVDNTFALVGRTRSLVRSRIAFHQALYDKAMAKECLAQSNYDEAIILLAKANRYFRSPKLTLGIVCLKVAPGLLRRRMLSRREALRRSED